MSSRSSAVDAPAWATRSWCSSTDLAPIRTGFFAHVEINSDPFETSAVSVCAHGEDSHLLVNVIAPYAGSIVVPPGTQFLEITAPGRWSIMRD